jgi:hypothetical protein
MKLFGSFLVFVWTALLIVASAQAGGLWLYEEATPDMGVGGAGRQRVSMPPLLEVILRR